jgi:preprotein translocase subunit SecB
MSENTTNNEPIFQIRRVYLKDASIEQPNSPQLLLSQEVPQVDIQLAVSVDNLEEGMVEVSVQATVTTKVENKVLCLIEAKQAGIFEMRNIPEDQTGPLLGIACPQIVYPYLRGNVADLFNRAGFPPVHLAEVNFQALYQQQLAQAQAQQAQVTGNTTVQ